MYLFNSLELILIKNNQISKQTYKNKSSYYFLNMKLTHTNYKIIHYNLICDLKN